MEENKEEIQWISKIRRHFHLRIENLQPPQDDQTMQKGGPPDDAAAGGR